MRFTYCLCLCVIALALPVMGQPEEFVYAEMEFPLSFVDHVQEYSFNPLSRFQTQVDGRLIELNCDSLVDLYQEGKTIFQRPCLGTWRPIKLRSREVLNFNLADVKWANGKPLAFQDVWFSLQYRKTNPLSWSSNKNLNIEKRGVRSFDAYLSDTPRKSPKAGEFFFPIVNKQSFLQARSPARAQVNKQKQKEIGYGRYFITDVQENHHIAMERRVGHPYYKNLKWPSGFQKIEKIRMRSFPKSRMTRNEQFVNGRVHMLTSATQSDVGYIINTYPEAKISRFYDDSFSCFMFNCRHPLFKAPAARRAFNYVFRKKLALRRALGGEGVIISGPLPKGSTYYNISVPPYQDDVSRAIAVLKLYRYWGLDAYEQKQKVVLLTDPIKGPCSELQGGDKILEVERKSIKTVTDLIDALESQKEKTIRVKVTRGRRIFTKRIYVGKALDVGEWNKVEITSDGIKNFPGLNLIANNPEGKNTLIKEVCGALKEDFKNFGIEVKIDYLDGKNYYPRIQKGDFDLAFRTLKITGTPSLYRMFYRDQKRDAVTNVNYGSYYNAGINETAYSSQNVTNVDILVDLWRGAHQTLHNDPPYLYLWSRRHILVYTHRLKIIDPNPGYKIPHGYKKIDGLINIFNEVHLWGLKEE